MSRRHRRNPSTNPADHNQLHDMSERNPNQSRTPENTSLLRELPSAPIKHEAPAKPTTPQLSYPVVIDRSKATVGHMATLRKLALAVNAQDNHAVNDLILDIIELIECLVVDFERFPASEFWPLVGEIQRQFGNPAGN